MASAVPFSDSGTSTQPVNWFNAFQVLSPWRNRIKVVVMSALFRSPCVITCRGASLARPAPLGHPAGIPVPNQRVPAPTGSGASVGEVSGVPSSPASGPSRPAAG